MFTCLVIVICLLGRSWFVSLKSSIFWCWLLLAVLFRFASIAVLAAMFNFCVGCCWPCCFVSLFALFDSVLTLEAQLLLQFFCDCNDFVSDFIGVFPRCMGFPWASALILFQSSWGVCPGSRIGTAS